MDVTADDRKELERVRHQLQEVTAERDKLLAENHRLHHEFGSPQKSNSANRSILVSATSSPSATGSAAINNEFPLSEKVRFFRSLFRGWEDVFARLWWSRKSQRVGYSPVCRHEWNPVYCGKPRVKCGNCPNQEYISITDEIIQDHLEGRHTIGIYPLLLDETCHFLAADFDKQSWMEDAAAFLETCHQMEIPAVVERSRSGNGAHVWIFFLELPADRNHDAPPPTGYGLL